MDVKASKALVRRFAVCLDSVSRRGLTTVNRFVTHVWRQIQVIWRDTGSTLKAAWIVLWIIGLVVLILGAWGDADGFWKNRPFLTNIFSAVTGAAFGIPLALVILQRVAASETDTAEARRAQRFAARVSADLAAAAGALIKGGESGIHEASAYLEEQLTPLRSYEDSPNSSSPNSIKNSYIEILKGTLERVLRHIDTALSTDKFQLLAEVSIQWSILNTEGRSRLLETGGRWLDALDARELARLVDRVAGPYFEIWHQETSECRQKLAQLSVENYDDLGFEMWDARHHLLDMAPFFDLVADLMDKTAAAAQALSVPSINRKE